MINTAQAFINSSKAFGTGLWVARDLVRAMGGTLKRTEWREYIVRFGSATYHTDSISDAILTARHMALEQFRTFGVGTN